MSLIERYIFKTATSAFLTGLTALTAVIWVATSLREIDLMTTKGQNLWVFLILTGLTVPSLILVIAPFALFLAILYTLNKLNSDSELVIMNAAGLPPGQLLRPFAILTLLVTLVISSISLQMMPWSFREIRALASAIRLDFLTRVVREGAFVTLDQGFVFHYRERGQNGALLGIFMQDRRDKDQITSYVAERGETVTADGRNLLVLENGSVQRQKASEEDAAIVVFDRYAIDLSQFAAADDSIPLRPRERSTLDLFHPDYNNPLIKMQEGRMRSELHERFVGPLYAIAFGLIAFAALSQARTTRQGRGAAMALAILAVVALRVAGFGASTLVVRQASATILVYGIPLLGVIAAVLMILSPVLPQFPRFWQTPTIRFGGQA
jgi:lipopolysaccharide export system permease protein